MCSWPPIHLLIVRVIGVSSAATGMHTAPEQDVTGLPSRTHHDGNFGVKAAVMEPLKIAHQTYISMPAACIQLRFCHAGVPNGEMMFKALSRAESGVALMQEKAAPSLRLAHFVLQPADQRSLEMQQAHRCARQAALLANWRQADVYIAHLGHCVKAAHPERAHSLHACHATCKQSTGTLDMQTELSTSKPQEYQKSNLASHMKGIPGMNRLFGHAASMRSRPLCWCSM